MTLMSIVSLSPFIPSDEAGATGRGWSIAKLTPPLSDPLPPRPCVHALQSDR